MRKIDHPLTHNQNYNNMIEKISSSKDISASEVIFKYGSENVLKNNIQFTYE